MNIIIVGTGYVGLVTGACFAEMGARVTCVDIDAEKIENLKKGIIPIYEPGLEPMVQRNVQAGRLHFTTDLAACLNGNTNTNTNTTGDKTKPAQTNIVFSAVGTPPEEDGSADIHQVLQVARTVGKHMNDYLFTTKAPYPLGRLPK